MEINKPEVENLIEEVISNVLMESKDEIKLVGDKISLNEAELERISSLFPITTEVLLKHWDILLDTTKNFLVISSTIFVTALALNKEVLINININFIRIVSIVIFLLSTIAIIYILYKRNNDKEEFIHNLSDIKNLYHELNNLRKELIEINSKKYREVLRKVAKEKLMENEFIQKNIPDL